MGARASGCAARMPSSSADPFQSVVGPTGPRDHRRHRHLQPPRRSPAPAGQGQARPVTGGRSCRPAWTARSCSTGPGEYEVKEVLVTGVRTYRDDARGAEVGQAGRLRRRGRWRPHHPPRRHRPPPVGGEARRHRLGRHRLRPARRLADAGPRRRAHRPARPEDRRPDADLRRRRRLRRGAEALLPRDGRPRRSPSRSCR